MKHQYPQITGKRFTEELKPKVQHNCWKLYLAKDYLTILLKSHKLKQLNNYNSSLGYNIFLDEHLFYPQGSS